MSKKKQKLQPRIPELSKADQAIYYILISASCAIGLLLVPIVIENIIFSLAVFPFFSN